MCVWHGNGRQAKGQRKAPRLERLTDSVEQIGLGGAWLARGRSKSVGWAQVLARGGGRSKSVGGHCRMVSMFGVYYTHMIESSTALGMGSECREGRDCNELHARRRHCLREAQSVSRIGGWRGA